jgi:ABC-type polysaccharide/polyol phosphate export permease
MALTGGVLVLGILCTRFRDVPQIVAAVLQLLFLLTPIIWTPESIRGKSVSVLLDFNPFYYLVEIVRGPLLGHPPDAYIWFVAGILSLTSLLAGHAFYGRFQHRVAYWL